MDDPSQPPYLCVRMRTSVCACANIDSAARVTVLGLSCLRVCEQRSQLDPSTVCDLLSVKINNDYPCYDSKSLMTNDLLKSATRRMLRKETDNVAQ